MPIRTACRRPTTTFPHLYATPDHDVEQPSATPASLTRRGAPSPGRAPSKPDWVCASLSPVTELRPLLLLLYVHTYPTQEEQMTSEPGHRKLMTIAAAA